MSRNSIAINEFSKSSFQNRNHLSLDTQSYIRELLLRDKPARPSKVGLYKFTHCNITLSKHWKHCPYCGTKIEWSGINE